MLLHSWALFPTQNISPNDQHTKMRFLCVLIALVLGLTSTILALGEPPPQQPQCPAIQATRQVDDTEHGQITPPESKVGTDGRDSCSQREQSCSHHGRTTYDAATSGSRRRPQTKKPRRLVFRHPLPARSILFYRARRYIEAWLEFEAYLRRQEFLAMRDHLARTATRHGNGYELKAGNYRIGPGRMRVIFM